MRYFFRKEHRLRKESEISPIFKEGKRAFVFPVKGVYRLLPESPDAPTKQVLIVAGKAYLKRAYMRNLAKRRMREAYRLNAPGLLLLEGQRLHLALLYVGRNSVATYAEIEHSVRSILAAIEKHLAIDANGGLNSENNPQ